MTVRQDEESVADMCGCIAREQGLDLTDEQLAIVVQTLVKSRQALLQLRRVELAFGPFYVEPATATAWLEDQGARRGW